MIPNNERLALQEHSRLIREHYRRREAERSRLEKILEAASEKAMEEDRLLNAKWEALSVARSKLFLKVAGPKKSPAEILRRKSPTKAESLANRKREAKLAAIEDETEKLASPIRLAQIAILPAIHKDPLSLAAALDQFDQDSGIVPFCSPETIVEYIDSESFLWDGRRDRMLARYGIEPNALHRNNPRVFGN